MNINQCCEFEWRSQKIELLILRDLTKREQFCIPACSLVVALKKTCTLIPIAFIDYLAFATFSVFTAFAHSILVILQLELQKSQNAEHSFANALALLINAVNSNGEAKKYNDKYFISTLA